MFFTPSRLIRIFVSRTHTLTALCFIFVLIFAGQPAPARADIPAQPSTTFPKPNGEVDAVALGPDGTLYIGGNFTSVGGQTRNRLAAITPGGTLSSWNPNVNGTVDIILISGSTVYVGGEFTSIGGTTRNHIAAVDASSGSVTSWNPNANDTVSAFALSGSTLYVGGDFTSIGGAERNFAAALSLTTGTAAGWNPDPDDSVFSLALDGSTIYLAGAFTKVDGSTRNHLAAVSSSGGIQNWNPNADGFVATLNVANGVIYAGGDFSNVGGSQRQHIAALTSSGTATSWAPNANDFVATIAVSGTAVYFGGDFTSVGGQTRKYGAAVDSAGMLISWNPNADDSIAAIAANANAVYAGGLFSTIGGQSIPYLAAYVGTSGGTGTDTTAPSVSIISPTSGATVSGTTTVSVSASDAVGVVRVDLYANDSLVSSDSTSPYSFSWTPGSTSGVSYTLRAKAYDAAGNIGTSSAVTVMAGTGSPATGGQVATPSFSPNGGTFTGSTLVYMTDTTPGAAIRYTTNGSIPTASSTLYTGAISISQTMVLKAVAFKDGMTPSFTASANFFFSSGAGDTGDNGDTGNDPGSGFPASGFVDLPPGTIVGDIVKFGSNPTIYLVRDDGLHAFDTYPSYQNYVAAYHKTVKLISDSAENYTIGQGFAREVITIPAAPANKYPTGTLINQNSTIYLIIGTSAVPFTNFAAFTGLGYKTANVVKGNVAGYTMATNYFITTANAKHPYGAWLRVDATHYYYMHASGMIRSPNSATFSTNGGQAKFILPANRFDLEVLEQSPNLTPLSQHDSRIY